MKHQFAKNAYRLEPAERERLWETIAAPLRSGHLPADGEASGLARWLEELRPFVTTGLVLAVSLLIVTSTVRTFVNDRQTGRVRPEVATRNGTEPASGPWTNPTPQGELTIFFEGRDASAAANPQPNPATTPAPRPPARLAICVRDAETGETLDHASVILADETDGEVTPLMADGVLRDVPPGPALRLYLSHLGYAPRETLLSIGEGATLELILALPPVIVGMLQTVDVEGATYPMPEPPGAPARTEPPFATPRELPRARFGAPAQPNANPGAAGRGAAPARTPQTGVPRPPSPPAPRTPALGDTGMILDMATPDRLAEGAPDPGFSASAAGETMARFHAEGAPSPTEPRHYLLRIGIQDPAARSGPVTVVFATEHVTAWRRVGSPGAWGSPPRAGDERLRLLPEGQIGTATGIFEIELEPDLRAALQHERGDAAVILARVDRAPADGEPATSWQVTTDHLRTSFDASTPRFQLACAVASLASGLHTGDGRSARDAWAAIATNLTEELATEPGIARVQTWLERYRPDPNRRD